MGKASFEVSVLHWFLGHLVLFFYIFRQFGFFTLRYRFSGGGKSRSKLAHVPCKLSWLYIVLSTNQKAYE